MPRVRLSGDPGDTSAACTTGHFEREQADRLAVADNFLDGAGAL